MCKRLFSTDILGLRRTASCAVSVKNNLIEFFNLFMFSGFLAQEAKHFFYSVPRISYFKSGTNIFELFILILTGGVVVQLGWYFNLGLATRRLDANDEAFSDILSQASNFVDAFAWAGIVSSSVFATAV